MTREIRTDLTVEPLTADVIAAVRRLIADQPDAATLAEALGVAL